jgi:hypothetical protein
MILSGLINLIKELLFALLVPLLRFLVRHSLGELFLQVRLEHVVVLTRQRFYSDCNLLAKVIGGNLRVWPPNKCLDRDDLLGSWLLLLLDDWGYLMREIKLEVNVGLGIFKERVML